MWKQQVNYFQVFTMLNVRVLHVVYVSRRRRCLLLNQVPLLAGAVVGLAAGWARSCWLLLTLLCAHRALIGLSNGIVLGVASLYLTEVAPVKHRGLIGACHQLFITIGTYSYCPALEDMGHA